MKHSISRTHRSPTVSARKAHRETSPCSPTMLLAAKRAPRAEKPQRRRSRCRHAPPFAYAVRFTETLQRQRQIENGLDLTKRQAYAQLGADTAKELPTAEFDADSFKEPYEGAERSAPPGFCDRPVPTVGVVSSVSQPSPAAACCDRKSEDSVSAAFSKAKNQNENFFLFSGAAPPGWCGRVFRLETVPTDEARASRTR